MSPRLHACALGLTLLAQQADAACRQALALALDVSGSVDAVEYRLQLDGLAHAISASEVQAAILAMPDAPIRLFVYEWSGFREQRILVDWTELATRDQILAVASRLRATNSAHINDPSTAIGPAMLFGADALAQQAGCWQKTLDISGDGPANIGMHPADVTESQLGEIIINALVIGPQGRANISKNLRNVKSLESYYRSFVLRGSGAFAEIASDHADFARAMQRKLLREITPSALSSLPQ